jgi:uncharacterized protein with PIN domain
MWCLAVEGPAPYRPMGNSAKRKEAAVTRQSQIRTKASRPLRLGDSPPRFVGDVMLGRLAKWLRLAGFDVLYSNRFSDDELISISNSDGRILLSRDTRLLIRKPVRNFIFLESQDIQDQIRQTFEVMQVTALPFLLTRCLSCNAALVEASREFVRLRIPPYVYETQSQFKSCPECGKVFWAGTHRKSVIQILKRLLQNG